MVTVAERPTASASDRALCFSVPILLPLLVLVLTPGLLLQDGTIDPFIYTGYIHDYRQLWEYFGATYYGNRVAAIDLSRITVSIAGDPYGYYLARYVLLVLMSASVMAIARRYYGTTVAAASAALVAFSPWYLRSIAWDYIDGFAISYLFVAFACLIAPRRHVGWWHAAAGAFFALAMNTNFFTLAVGGTFAPSWILLRRGQPVGAYVKQAAALVAGFVLAYLALMVAVHLEFPNRAFFFEWATLSMINDLLINGVSQEWFQPLAVFLAKQHYYVFVPLSVCAALAVVWFQTRTDAVPSERRSYVTATLVYFTLMIVMYLVNHFVLHHGRITLFYYFSYGCIPACFAVIAVIGEVTARLDSRAVRIALGSAVLLYIVAFVTVSPAWKFNPTVLTVWAVTAVALPVSAAFRGAAWRVWPILLCIVSMPLAFYHSSEDFVALHSGEQAAVEWDVYRASIDFEREIGRIFVPQENKIKFWYDQSLPHHGGIGAVQSIYLWGFSRVPKMPTVDADFRKRIVNARQLVLMGMTAEEVDRGLSALSTAGIEYRLVDRKGIGGSTWSFQFAAVELPEPKTAKAPPS